MANECSSDNVWVGTLLSALSSVVSRRNPNADFDQVKEMVSRILSDPATILRMVEAAILEASSGHKISDACEELLQRLEHGDLIHVFDSVHLWDVRRAIENRLAYLKIDYAGQFAIRPRKALTRESGGFRKTTLSSIELEYLGPAGLQVGMFHDAERVAVIKRALAIHRQGGRSIPQVVKLLRQELQAGK